MSKKQTVKSRYEQYRADVTSGKIIACQAVISAVNRSFQDDKRSDLSLDFNQAGRVVDFIENCLFHFEGEWSGKPFILQNWQIFVILELFGRLKGKLRKYTQAYIQTGRKNGKSSFLAALGAYSLLGAQEPAAQVFSVATTREQACITRDQARFMIKKNPDLKKFIKELNRNLYVPKTNSKFIALSSDANVLDGLNPAFSIIDELAAHPTDEIWSVMTTATASRREPLTVAITTPLFLREQSVALDRYHYGKQILDGTLENDSFFPFICELDPDDDWLDESTWGKANPSLGVCCHLKTLQEAAEQARIIPAAESAFKMRHLSLWQEGTSSWINISDWDECEAPEKDTEHLNGAGCYGGLDLADTDDFSAFVLIFPGDPLEILSWFWCPEATVRERQRKGKVPYHRWVKSGHLIETPGNVVNYSAIEEKIIELSKRFNIIQVGHDPHNATGTTTRLIEEGIEMTRVKQTAVELSEATKEARRLILTRKLRHYGNPVMRFCVGNVMIAVDPNMNEKILKQKSIDKVDGAAALVDAVTVFIRKEPDDTLYEHEGIMFV